MKIAAIVRPNNGCSFYRILLPLEYMPWDEKDLVKLFYPEGTVINEKDKAIAGTVSEIDSYNPEIIFFNASFLNHDNNIEWLKLKKKEGVKLVSDIDDYWEMSPSHPNYKLWYDSNYNKKTIEVIKLSDVVFCTGDFLYKKCKDELNVKAIVIPNAVPYGTKNYEKNSIKVDTGKTNFIYAGGSTHYYDLLI